MEQLARRLSDSWSYFGQENSGGQLAVFIICAIIDFLCLYPAWLFFRRTPTMTATWVMPVLCFLLCYVNIIMALGDSIDNDNAAAVIGTVMYALVVPLFLVALFEMAYSVHKTRSVKFCGIVFDVSGAIAAAAAARTCA
jgi:hypothetical protein